MTSPRSRRDQVENIRNLLYLIGLKADDPATVRGYVEVAEHVLKDLARSLSADQPTDVS